MIELYTWSTPNGRKVSIMLEECGLPYNVHKINIGTNAEQFTPEYLKINPNGKIPSIVDPDGPDGKPIAMMESGAILIYLAGKTGKFLPNSERGKYEALQWLMFQMGGVGPMFGQAHHFMRAKKDEIPVRQRALRQRGQAPLRRDGPAPCEERLFRARVLDRRHGDLSVGGAPRVAPRRPGGVPGGQALVRRGRGAAGGGERNGGSRLN